MKYTILLIVCALSLSACQKDSNTQAQVATESQSTAERASVDPRFLKVDAPSKPPAEWTFLTADYFHYTFIDRINEKIDRSEYIGRWIDLKDDWTYEGGFLGETRTAGIWEYDHDSKILDLIPVDGSKRSQWRLLHNNDRVVMAGTNLYGDNSTQIRWERRPEKPARVDQ